MAAGTNAIGRGPGHGPIGRPVGGGGPAVAVAEQLAVEADQVGRLLEAGAGSLSTALSLDDYNAGPSGDLALVEKARASLEVPVIASLNGVAPGAWVEHAGLLEEAGADALELNVYAVSSSPGVSGAEVEGRYLELVGASAGRSASPWRSSWAPTSARWPT
jgi:hypothetical protein